LNSVNTNVGALVALQNLNRTNSELDTVQGRINTGLKVASARDNGAIWAIAQGQRSDIRSLDSVKTSLNRAQSTVDVAINAGESISDLLIQMKEKALAASDRQLDATSRTALNADFKALRDQIGKIVSNAEFNGSNMIKTGATAYMALANEAGTSRITVAAEVMGLGQAGALTTVAATASFNTATQASTMITNVETAINAVSASLARLGTGSKALGTHLDFISKLQDTLEAGVGNLVDADLAKESARLQSLQTKQQLGIQALAIANSSASSLLGLFR
jgi:flagellin